MKACKINSFNSICLAFPILMFTWRLLAYRSQLTRKGRNTLHNVSRLTKQARFRDPETKTNIVIGGDKIYSSFRMKMARKHGAVVAEW